MNELWKQRSRNDWQTEIEATRPVLHAPRTAPDTVRLHRSKHVIYRIDGYGQGGVA